MTDRRFAVLALVILGPSLLPSWANWTILCLCLVYGLVSSWLTKKHRSDKPYTYDDWGQ